MADNQASRPRAAPEGETAGSWRREWLICVRAETVTIQEVLEAACADENRSLRRITLVQLLAAQPRWTRARARAFVEGLQERLGKVPAERDVGWLLDPRASGRRQQVWAEMHGTVPELGERFPF